MNGYGQCVWVGEGFLKNDKWEIKLLSEFFSNSHSTHLWMTQTQEIITHRILKIYTWIWGMCMSGGRFLKEWQETDKFIEWIFFQITFNFLWMTQTQEIITHRILKIHTWIWGMCNGGAKFLKQWQVTYKSIEWIFFQFTFKDLWMTETQEMITDRV